MHGPTEVTVLLHLRSSTSSRVVATALIAASLTALNGCPEPRPFGTDDGGGDGARTDANGSRDGDGASTGGDGGNSSQDVMAIPIDGGGDGCSDAARLVYVLSDENDLYSFRPDRREFTRIGRLDCPTSLSPNSMAIDRQAVAWVNYVDSDGFGDDTAGLVYRVSTADAHCTSDAPFSLPDGWYRLGMGFSTDSVEGADETLYVTGTAGPFSSSPGLGFIDRMTLRLTPIGRFSGSLRDENAELTGTGDGRLFGFFTTTPVQVARIDKVTAAISSAQSLPQVETPAAWAFSFWGGDFYLYTAPDPIEDPSRTSNVTRYRPSDGSVDASYMTNVGFRIVGAGVSTCAPIQPPG
jgi:hypothetical protein